MCTFSNTYHLENIWPFFRDAETIGRFFRFPKYAFIFFANSKTVIFHIIELQYDASFCLFQA